MTDHPHGAAGRTSQADVLLVTCVKAKRPEPAPAKDLYDSPLFRKQRAYAELRGEPWYILSAEHGLVRPDEWLAPYERYLPQTPQAYRAAWGAWVVERLDLLAGPLQGMRIEVHASASYLQEITGLLRCKGAVVITPLAGLSMGQRLAWYGSAHASEALRDTVDEIPGDFAAALRDAGRAKAPAELTADGSARLRTPGLYSWWVDEEGARELTSGLDVELPPGLIYAGLAGATRWPSDKRSTNTLWSRIHGMHLGGRHEYSTFRRTLGAILASARGQSFIDEAQLTGWMHEHLRVVAVPYEDADTLGRVERKVLAALDPPLNLQSMPKTELRLRLSELRRPFSDGSAEG